MPCRSDHLEQNGREKALQQTSNLLEYAMGELALRGVNHHVPRAALDPSGSTYYAQDVGQVQALCRLIRNMTDEDREAVVYNAHSVKSRQLAAWWEAHEAADAKEAVNLEREAAYDAEAESIFQRVIAFDDDEAIEILARAHQKVIAGMNSKRAA